MIEEKDEIACRAPDPDEEFMSADPRRPMEGRPDYILSFGDWNLGIYCDHSYPICRDKRVGLEGEDPDLKWHSAADESWLYDFCTELARHLRAADRTPDSNEGGGA